MKIFRYLLYPISILYGGIILLRNKLYDRKILRSASFDFPLICVGNLVIGGSGKTPMIELLIENLKTTYKVATLSRGYGRKSHGFILAEKGATARDIGDEPLQFHTKFPDVTVAVCEARILGIPSVLDLSPATEVILLDDAFQHREIRPGYNILLTEYANPYFKDHLIPTGRLRDVRSSSKRAQCIVVTKCPDELSSEDCDFFRKALKPEIGQRIYFTSLAYESPYQIFSGEPRQFGPNDHVLLVTGIANPAPIHEHIAPLVGNITPRAFPDHHVYTEREILDFIAWLQSNSSSNKILLTTEKDAMRLKGHESALGRLPVYALPVKHKFLFGQEVNFQNDVREFIRNFKIA